MPTKESKNSSHEAANNRNGDHHLTDNHSHDTSAGARKCQQHNISDLFDEFLSGFDQFCIFPLLECLANVISRHNCLGYHSYCYPDPKSNL